MDEDVLIHYGKPRRSGRYPWGSGEDPHQHTRDVLDDISDLKMKGLTERQISERLGYSSTTQLRAAKAIANNKRMQDLADGIDSRLKRGMNNSEIARDLGISEGKVRYYKNNQEEMKKKQLHNTSDMLKDTLKDTPYLDVGLGVEQQLGVSRQKLNVAVAELQQQGYYVHNLYVPYANNPGNGVTVKVLTKEPNRDVVKKHKDEVASPNKKSEDGGLTYTPLHKPKPVSWNEVGIVYGKNGENDRDGLIQVRRGVDGLDLGGVNYAQVRINIDGTHYMKGMAVYADDLPKGKNLVFNTNKPEGTPKEKVFKPLKDNSTNPFGARIIAQRGKFNIVNEEGTWSDWDGSKFSAQFLSKQPLSLVKDRVSATYDKRAKDFDEIMHLTNDVVKKKLLNDFVDTTESAQAELQVMGLPHTKAHVLIPYPELKPNQIYAPNYKNGDKVVLIRYPHAGTFEIPELTVNNKLAKAKKQIGAHPLDAVGIHPSVAHKLSGADFDGDVVYVIPNNKRQLKSTDSLKGLKDFDPNSYTIDRSKPGAPKKITGTEKQHEMGKVSNLIADMTIQKASVSEITRAVRHSMVVIDSEKHDLDWKQSEKDNGIAALKNKYQKRPSVKYDPETGEIKVGRTHIGGSTLITRADTPAVSGYEKYHDGTLKTKTVYATRKVKVQNTDAQGKPLFNKNGTPKTHMVEEKIPLLDSKGNQKLSAKGKKMYELTTAPVEITKPIINLVKDASVLSSGTAVEKAYVDYINKLKVISNKAQKEAAHITPAPRNPEARKTYAKEVASLNAKLKAVEANKPYERQAQIIANININKKMKEDMTKDQITKLRQISMDEARAKVGSLKKKDLEITFTDREWEAVQAGAISPTKLENIISNANSTQVRQLATPRPSRAMDANKLGRAKAMLANGRTNAEVAEALGVSTSTLEANIRGKVV